MSSFIPKAPTIFVAALRIQTVFYTISQGLSLLWRGISGLPGAAWRRPFFTASVLLSIAYAVVSQLATAHVLGFLSNYGIHLGLVHILLSAVLMLGGVYFSFPSANKEAERRTAITGITAVLCFLTSLIVGGNEPYTLQQRQQAYQQSAILPLIDKQNIVLNNRSRIVFGDDGILQSTIVFSSLDPTSIEAFELNIQGGKSENNGSYIQYSYRNTIVLPASFAGRSIRLLHDDQDNPVLSISGFGVITFLSHSHNPEGIPWMPWSQLEEQGAIRIERLQQKATDHHYLGRIRACGSANMIDVYGTSNNSVVTITRVDITNAAGQRTSTTLGHHQYLHIDANPGDEHVSYGVTSFTLLGGHSFSPLVACQ